MSHDQDDAPALFELIQNVEKYTRAYVAAKERAQGAANEARDALRDLDGAQKALDTVLESLRRRAPAETNWHRFTVPERKAAVT